MREALARERRPVADREYFAGVVACKFNRPSEARARLGAFVAGHPYGVHARRARECLVEVEKRAQNFGAAADQLERILRDFATELTSDERFDDSSSARYLRALASVAPMRRSPGGPDTLAITVHSPGGIEGGVRIDGHPAAFGFDTGANFSICGDSTATALGLRTVARDVPLGTINDQGLTAEFRIADSLEIGGVTLLDVPFLVIPEAMMRISGGTGLVGFPVAASARRFVMRYGPPAATSGAPAPLAIDGLNPVTTGSCGGVPLVMTIDSGASRTIFYPRFHRRAQERHVAFTNPDSAASTGLGGTTRLPMTRLRHGDLGVGGFTARLENCPTWLTARSDASRVFDANLGNDVMRQMGTVVFDFERMTFGVH